MNPFTKEQLLNQARENVKALKMAVVQNAFKDIRHAIELDLALAEITLAGMEAEPVGVTDKSEIECLKRGEMANVMPPDYKGCDSGDSVYLYDAPQPLTTSERAELENYRKAPDLKSDDGLENLLWYAREATCHSDPNYACEYGNLAAPGVVASFLEELLRYRNAQQVVPDEVMPGGLVYSSALPKFESNDSDKVVGYHCFISGDTRTVDSQEQAYSDAKSVVSSCRAAMQSGAVKDGWVMVPNRLTAENFAKAALSGEFYETKFINCHECFGDDECETCDGSGRIEIKVPVSWTNIKAIWEKGIEHFSAAPQQEAE